MKRTVVKAALTAVAGNEYGKNMLAYNLEETLGCYYLGRTVKSNGFTVTLISHEGNHADGEELVRVYKVEDESGDVAYAQVKGFYSSFEGIEFENEDDFTLVTPKQVEVTIYEDAE